jgi:hypothetical protein
VGLGDQLGDLIHVADDAHAVAVVTDDHRHRVVAEAVNLDAGRGFAVELHCQCRHRLPFLCPPLRTLSHSEFASIVDMTQAVKDVGKTEEVAIVYIRDVPEDVHRRMKAAAALLGESMQAAALRALEAEVERMETRVERQRRKREGER